NLAESRAINTSLPIRLYNGYDQGAYILFNDIPVFMDSRVNIYTKPFSKNLDRDLFVDYQIIDDASSLSSDNKKGTNNPKNSDPIPSDPDKNYEELISLYSPTHFLLANNSTLAKTLENNPSYEKIYSDDSFVIFEPLASSK
ncbi:hypothetical protein IKF63_00520, partial [Candidatus Saccharibacteria bacterium]|nr:hypothetical protein [Candidatus Saccharibacteria bacterium]